MMCSDLTPFLKAKVPIWCMKTQWGLLAPASSAWNLSLRLGLSALLALDPKCVSRGE